MKVVVFPDTLPVENPTVVTVGNFDGIHTGHQILLQQLRETAQSISGLNVVVTFDPHTRAVLYPELNQQVLTTFEEKAVLLEKHGVDFVYKVPFSNEFGKMEPEEFVEKVLLEKLHAVSWILGEGHAVGKDRAGGKKFLRQVMSRYHISIFAADLYARDGITVSSTSIRKSIIEGNLRDAVSMLGHPYLINAVRIHGRRIGTQIGYPTLNFQKPSSDKVLPPSGIYAAKLETGKDLYKGALYFGACPTFPVSQQESEKLTQGQICEHFEFHALEHLESEPKEGEMAKIWVYEHIRPDETFPSPDLLVKQIEIDIQNIKDFFSTGEMK